MPALVVRRCAAVLGGALVAAVVTACTTTTTRPATTVNQPPPDSAAARPASSGPAAVGDTLSLRGADDGEAVDVTAVRVIDHALGTETDFSPPPDGKHYYAVQFRIKNTGTRLYEDAPSNGAKLIDATGQTIDAAQADETTAGESFPANTTVAPGASALGCLTFEIANGATIARVQFGMDSGFGQVAQWQVPAPTS